jgi:hypothetical protein
MTALQYEQIEDLREFLARLRDPVRSENLL